MPEDSPLYDLTLLLSTEVEDEQRTNILSEVENAISSAGGSIERRNDWGVRPMAFRIQHQSEADYRLLQFTGPPALLESLSHSLRIADDVLRFRIIKVVPGTPAAPESAPPVIGAAAHGGSSRDGTGRDGSGRDGSGESER
jgi:small subunit ribosomal protein S6